MVDLYETEIKRFQDLLKENEPYAFERYGWTMLYSVHPEETHELKSNLGWKPVTGLDHYNTGTTLCRSGKIPQGLKHLELAREMNLDTPELYYNLALAYERAEDKRKAKSLFRKFIEVVEKQDRIKPSLRQSLDDVRTHLQEM